MAPRRRPTQRVRRKTARRKRLSGSAASFVKEWTGNQLRTLIATHEHALDSAPLIRARRHVRARILPLSPLPARSAALVFGLNGFLNFIPPRRRRSRGRGGLRRRAPPIGYLLR